MALTLIVTPKATNANGYVTVAEADAFMSYHPQAAAIWDALDPDVKIQGIVTATRALDEMVFWDGFKQTIAQALRWPRAGVTDRDGYMVAVDVIPTFLKNATAELARYLIAQDRMKAIDDSSAGLTSVTAGPVSVTFDKSDRLEALPDSVLSMIYAYSTGQSGGVAVGLVRA